MDRDDVFCVYRNSKTGKSEVCILKSKAMASFMECDKMTYEEAEEFFNFNVAGAMGKGQYSIIDDSMDLEYLRELIDTKEVYDPAEHD